MGKRYRVVIITVSDKGSIGEREDISGPVIQECLETGEYNVVDQMLLPDGVEKLSEELIRICDNGEADLILTTGGTGFSPRDLTPEATLSVAERQVPGIPEAIRSYSMQYTKRAMLSRGIAVIRKNTLIINLPGSPKAVRESMEAFLEVLPHGLEILRGDSGDCGEIS